MLVHRDDFLFPIEAHFNKIFEQFLSANNNSLKDSLKSSTGYPKMDVVEDKDSLYVKCALPGMKLDDISVEFDLANKNYPQITVSGKMSQVHESSNSAKYYVKELRQSSFKRTFVLPDYVKDEPEAFLEDGILTLKWAIPEDLKDPVPKKIAIKQIKK